MAEKSELMKQIYDLVVKEYPEVDVSPVEFSLELTIDRYEYGKFVGRAGRLVLMKSREHFMLSEVMHKLFKYFRTEIEIH